MIKSTLFKLLKKSSFKIKFIWKILFILIFLIPSLPEKSYGNESNIKLDKSYLTKEVNQPYILGGGDLILIEISQIKRDLNKAYRINGSGIIDIKGLGKLYVEGLTVSELEKVLSEKYEEIIFDSDIKIRVKEHRLITINVQGEVYSPGIINLRGEGTFFTTRTKGAITSNTFNDSGKNVSAYSENSDFPTLYDAIRNAGGITLNSDLENIEVIRKNSISNGGGLKKANINFLDFLYNQRTENNIRIFDEDTIIIKKSNKPDNSLLLKAMRTNINPKTIEVTISGKIANRGNYQLSRVATLNDAIEFAGGQLPISGKITLGRIEGDGSVIKKTIRYKRSNKRGSESNPYLMQGDIIHVGSSGFNKLTSIINEVTSPISGIVNTYYLYKIFE